MHEPQCAGLERKSTQVPLHSERPSRQTQAPPEHPNPGEQVTPHAPQFRESLLVSTQLPPHSVAPPEQAPVRHTPDEQVSSAPHGDPHAPQLARSFRGSVQLVPHEISPKGQPHRPAAHCSLELQAWPQLPQFLGSLSRSKHPRSHAVSPVPQLCLHSPAVHTSRAGQRTPQAPQLSGLLAGFTHVPLQSTVPSAQTHFDLPQTCPTPHAIAQRPQCFASLPRSKHPPEQLVSPCAHDKAQVPRLQLCDPEHALPQLPQLVGSVLIAVQVPLHPSSPRPQ